MGKTCSGYDPRIFAMRQAQALNEQLRDERFQRVEKMQLNKQLRKSYWWQRMASAMSDLKHIDPDGWEAWFDSDAVPEFGTDKSRALLVEQRIQSLLSGTMYTRAIGKLYRGVFIWQDKNGAFIFGEDGKIREFVNELEVRAFVDASYVLSGSLLSAFA